MARAIQKSAEQRSPVSGTALTLYAELCRPLCVVEDTELVLGPDSEPTELRSTLHSHAIVVDGVFVRNHDITSDSVDNSYAYPFGIE